MDYLLKKLKHYIDLFNLSWKDLGERESRNLNVFLMNPLISHLQYASKKEVKQLFDYIKLYRIRKVAGGMDIHDLSLSGAYAFVRKKLYADKEPLPALHKETLLQVFEPLMCSEGDKQAVVAQYVRFLIDENTKLKDHNLCVVETLYHIMTDKESLKIDLAILISTLYESATAYEQKSAEPELISPYSCHPGSEERLFLALQAIFAENDVVEEDVPIDAIVHRMFVMAQKGLVCQLNQSFEFERRFTAWIDYEASELLQEGGSDHPLVRKVTKRASVPIRVDLLQKCYTLVNQQYRRQKGRAIEGYQGELPERFENRLALCQWARNHRREVIDEREELLNPEVFSGLLIERLMSNIDKRDQFYLTMPFWVEALDDRGFSMKLQVYVESRLEEIKEAVKPNFPLLTDATKAALRKYRALVVDRLWDDEQSYLDGFVFGIDDIDESKQRVYAGRFSEITVLDTSRYSQSLGNRMLIAHALTSSQIPRVSFLASQFLTKFLDLGEKQLKAFVSGANNHGQRSVIETLCEMAVQETVDKTKFLNACLGRISSQSFRSLLDSASEVERERFYRFESTDDFVRLLEAVEPPLMKELFLKMKGVLTKEEIKDRLFEPLRPSSLSILQLISGSINFAEAFNLIADCLTKNQLLNLIFYGVNTVSWPFLDRFFFFVMVAKVGEIKRLEAVLDGFKSSQLMHQRMVMILREQSLSQRFRRELVSPEKAMAGLMLDVLKNALTPKEYEKFILSGPNDDSGGLLVYLIDNKKLVLAARLLADAEEKLSTEGFRRLLLNVGKSNSLRYAVQVLPRSILNVLLKKFKETLSVDELSSFIFQWCGYTESEKRQLLYSAVSDRRDIIVIKRLLLCTAFTSKKTAFFYSFYSQRILSESYYQSPLFKAVVKLSDPTIGLKLHMRDTALHLAIRNHDIDVFVLLFKAANQGLPKFMLRTLIYFEDMDGYTVLDLLDKEGLLLIFHHRLNLSVYAARQIFRDEEFARYAQRLSQEGLLSIWDRIYLFLIGAFSLAFSLPSIKSKSLPQSSSDLEASHMSQDVSLNPEVSQNKEKKSWFSFIIGW